jgi:hypothetical protein
MALLIMESRLPRGGSMPHGDADQGVYTPRSTFYDQGRFGRLFPTLPPFASDTPLVRAALSELGRPGGPMDAGDDLSDPIALISQAELSVDNPDNSRLTAGMTFLGQFLDHDMTFDPTSSLARVQDPESIRNFRIPALDLDSVYGGGPGVSPHLYDREVDAGRTTLLVEAIPGSEGPVGGRIVAEVIHGLMDGDPSSYLSQEPDWTPTYGSDDTFVITDLLAAAGVVGSLS